MKSYHGDRALAVTSYFEGFPLPLLRQFAVSMVQVLRLRTIVTLQTIQRYLSTTNLDSTSFSDPHPSSGRG